MHVFNMHTLCIDWDMAFRSHTWSKYSHGRAARGVRCSRRSTSLPGPIVAVIDKHSFCPLVRPVIRPGVLKNSLGCRHLRNAPSGRSRHTFPVNFLRYLPCSVLAGTRAHLELACDRTLFAKVGSLGYRQTYLFNTQFWLQYTIQKQSIFIFYSTCRVV